MVYPGIITQSKCKAALHNFGLKSDQNGIFFFDVPGGKLKQSVVNFTQAMVVAYYLVTL